MLGPSIGSRKNILVLNDEAHHAYRIRQDEPDPNEEVEADDLDEFYKAATVWVDGLDRIHKLRGINVCVDLSATPYYLAVDSAAAHPGRARREKELRRWLRSVRRRSILPAVTSAASSRWAC